MRRDKGYPVRVLNREGYEDHWISPVTAVDGRNNEEVSRCIAEADIMATAVGVRVLPLIAPVIAEGLRKRFSLTEKPLNIIICENLIDANLLLKKLIKENLNVEEGMLFEKRIGLVEASIGRMVPIQTDEMRDGNPLRVCVEAYSFLPIDKSAIAGKAPLLKGAVLCEKFDFYIQRKLFIHNMGHAICAYLGMLLGDRYIADTIGRGDVLFIVQNAMQESARALSQKFDMPLDDLLDHINDLLQRFSNHALGDTCNRVGADIERKLGAKDRFIGSIQCCTEQGIIPAFTAIGAAAALRCYLKENKLPELPDTAKQKLWKLSNLPNDSPETALILSMYTCLADGKTISELCQTAMSIRTKPEVI
ncbi:mannitol-1-phosphate 5-dehydrogenase [Spirochaetia bacterium]|nr:mannitol-1-phosphate 5-dehydrogenase [Spirochaetia bacterium]